MPNNDILNLVGMLCNIIGSILLTVSLSKYLTSMHGALAIHDMQIKAILKRDDKVLTGDIANLLTQGVKSGRTRTIIGLIVIVIGFVIQAIPCIINIWFKE